MRTHFVGEVVVALLGEWGRGFTLGLGGGGFMSIARSVAARLSIANEGDIAFESTIRKKENERAYISRSLITSTPLLNCLRSAYFSLLEPLVVEMMATI